jgi:hypothetical protein
VTLLTLLRSPTGASSVHQEWDCSWLVGPEAAPVHQGWLSSWVVRTEYVPQPVALQRTCRWRVLAEPAAVRLSRQLGWRVLESVGQQWDGGWLVRDVSPVAQQWTGAWRARNLVRLATSPAWAVGRRAADVDPFAQLNGISLHVVEMDPGGSPLKFDLIEHYDRSLVMHNVRPDLYECRVRIRVTGSSPSDLQSQENAIAAACLAGGTFAWQSVDANGVTGPMVSYSVAPSDEPSFVRDQERESLFRSYSDLRLRIWP